MSSQAIKMDSTHYVRISQRTIVLTVRRFIEYTCNPECALSLKDLLTMASFA